MSEVTMMDYINETPEVVLNNVKNSKALVGKLVDFYLENGYQDVVVVASGSSYNGAMCARTYMRKYLQCEVKMLAPFTFVNYEHQYINPKSMLVFISQSGCSTNTLDAIRFAKEKGCKTVCLVGRDDNDAKDIADLTLNWGCGEEKVGFVTKGVVTLALYLMLFALETALIVKRISEEDYQGQLAQFRLAMEIHPQMVEETKKKFEQNFKAFTSKDNMYVLGTGPSYGVAIEAALKISETNGLMAVGVETEEFLHGPIYPTNPDTLVLVIDNNANKSTERSVDIAKANNIITEKTFCITNSENYDDARSFRTEKQTSCHVSVLYKLACIQTLSYLMTMATNKFEPHPTMKRWKKTNAVAAKSRANLYLDLQKANQ